jgi:hypothetical protein
MESEAGDTLRDDEIKFMDVSKNYFFLTQSDQLTEQKFNKKIFYSANNEDGLNLLDSYEGIKKISNNILLKPNEVIGVAEYGIMKDASLSTLEQLTQEHPQALIASSVT